MNVQNFLDLMKKIQECLLTFMESESDSEENFQNLQHIFDEEKISDNQYKLKLLLYLISKIGQNHYRTPNFFNKLEKILQIFSDDIIKFFSNSEIFKIFKNNKRILLFLIEKKILIIDENIAQKLVKKNSYMQYFSPEIKSFVDKNNNDNLSENFYELRKEGENETIICKIIREDNIKEFLVYINKNTVPLNEPIKLTSFYETNSFLLEKREVTMIEYAAFFGSIQIFNYLRLNNAKLTPSLWIFAIHGRNSEIIHQLEVDHITPPDNSYNNCFIESIKCHNNNEAKYFLDNFLQNEYSKNNSLYPIKSIIKYYNFAFFENETINNSTFNDLCYYDYYLLVNDLLTIQKVDINQKIIFL